MLAKPFLLYKIIYNIYKHVSTPPFLLHHRSHNYNLKHNALGSEVAKANTKARKDALELHQDGGFPSQLLLTRQTKPQMPIPAVDFSEKTPQSIGDLLNKEIKIYVTPTEYFTTKFREIFKHTQIQFKSSKYARKWLGGPNMSFWPQQLNFALWCATTGCGVSRDMLFPSSLNLNPQIRSFYLFHVYFTVRHILYEMGGIQAISALPDDPTFNQKDNKYNVASYERICGDFGIDPNSDFRFTHGQNHGLGYVNVKYPDGHDFAFKKWTYSPADLTNPSSQRFADEGGTDDAGNKIDFIRNDQGAAVQFEYFVANHAQGLTLEGLARINQSIEAFCYCVLGAFQIKVLVFLITLVVLKIHRKTSESL